MDLHSNHFSLSGIDPSLSLSFSFSLNFLTSFLNFLMKLKEEKIMGEFFLCLKGFSCSFCSFVSLLPLDGLSRILAALPRACLALANGSRGVEVQQVPGSCLVSFFFCREYFARFEKKSLNSSPPMSEKRTYFDKKIRMLS